MFSLSDLMISADGGENVERISQQYGLSKGETKGVIEAVLPAFSQGLAQNASSPDGAASFLQALASGQHAKYFDDPEQALSAQGRAEGNGILGHLFGSKDLSRMVAAEASKATGIDVGIIKQLLPSLAAMVMGGMFKESSGQMRGATAQSDGGMLGQILEQLSGGQSGGSGQSARSGGGGIGDLLGSILGGGRGAGSAQGSAGGDNPFGDILGRVLGGGNGGGQASQPEQQASAPRGDNPLGSIFDSFLGNKGHTPASVKDEVVASRVEQTPAQASASDNPLVDILGKMFQPGTTGPQSNSNVDTGSVMKSIFDQFTKR